MMIENCCMRDMINPSVEVIVVYLCVCLSAVCVCVLSLISYTTRFGDTVKQRVERSFYDIPNLCGDFRKTS